MSRPASCQNFLKRSDLRRQWRSIFNSFPHLELSRIIADYVHQRTIHDECRKLRGTAQRRVGFNNLLNKTDTFRPLYLQYLLCFLVMEYTYPFFVIIVQLGAVDNSGTPAVSARRVPNRPVKLVHCYASLIY